VSSGAGWLREERRRTLGDWVAVCPDCGHAQRYFEGDEASVAGPCPTCGAALMLRCPACEARIASVFAVDCEACGAALREPTRFGVPIRRAGR
jgi:ribosomal protein S27E